MSPLSLFPPLYAAFPFLSASPCLALPRPRAAGVVPGGSQVQWVLLHTRRDRPTNATRRPSLQILHLSPYRPSLPAGVPRSARLCASSMGPAATCGVGSPTETGPQSPDGRLPPARRDATPRCSAPFPVSTPLVPAFPIAPPRPAAPLALAQAPVPVVLVVLRSVQGPPQLAPVAQKPREYCPNQVQKPRLNTRFLQHTPQAASGPPTLSGIGTPRVVKAT